MDDDACSCTPPLTACATPFFMHGRFDCEIHAEFSNSELLCKLSAWLTHAVPVRPSHELSLLYVMPCSVRLHMTVETQLRMLPSSVIDTSPKRAQRSYDTQKTFRSPHCTALNQGTRIRQSGVHPVTRLARPLSHGRTSKPPNAMRTACNTPYTTTCNARKRGGGLPAAEEYPTSGLSATTTK